MPPLKRTSVAAEIGLVVVILAVSFAFTVTRTQASNRSIICSVLLVLGAVCLVRLLWPAPRPAWSKQLEAKLLEIRSELAAISITDARIRALQYLTDCETGAKGALLTPSKARSPALDYLPAGVRDIFSRYDRVEWPGGIARIGVQFISRPGTRKERVVIGYMFGNDSALLVRDGDERVYQIDRGSSETESGCFPSIYHWILYRKAVEETPFDPKPL